MALNYCLVILDNILLYILIVVVKFFFTYVYSHSRYVSNTNI